jgi:hypothetical protein
LSTDTFTSPESQHATEVEPGAASFGSTILTAFQVARIFSGGGADIGFAISADGGATWTSGLLPGLTVNYQGGTAAAASDAVPAYDAKHRIWMISSLAVGTVVNVVVSRSHDGLTWDTPISVSAIDADKNWLACDNTASSPFYGNCYVEWDDPNNGLVWMSTSSDGGLTWQLALNTADHASGLSGQPVVQPNGTVIVPMNNNPASGPISAILSFRSTDGGATWSATTTISSLTDHAVAGNLRSEPLPTAQVDGAGNVFVIWQDCRFRTACASNDLIMSTSADGLAWTTPVRIPLDATTSTVDHFIPGLGVDPATAGSSAHLAVGYYFYPTTNCGSSCALSFALVTSQDGGSSWSQPETFVSSIAVSSLPNTVSGRMVADYVSTVFSGGKAFTFFVLANPPTGTVLDQAIYTNTIGVAALARSRRFVSHDERVVPGARSDYGPSGYYDLEHKHRALPPAP